MSELTTYNSAKGKAHASKVDAVGYNRSNEGAGLDLRGRDERLEGERLADSGWAADGKLEDAAAYVRLIVDPCVFAERRRLDRRCVSGKLHRDNRVGDRGRDGQCAEGQCLRINGKSE
jgi:hypothetical protein